MPANYKPFDKEEWLRLEKKADEMRRMAIQTAIWGGSGHVGGLINIIYTFNPPLIVLGGGILNEDYIIDLIDRKIYNKLMEPFKNVNIVRSRLGNQAALLGVAYKASQK